jgi:hypothetical protein
MMIFKHTWKQVLSDEKIQTRRPVKSGETCRDGITVSKHWISRFTFMPLEGANLLKWTYMNPRWQVGRTYAVQPGRGKKAVGRIRITGIRREWLDDISGEDCLAEGIQEIPNQWGTPWYRCPGLEGEWKSSRAAFRALWDNIYEGTEFEFDANPEVWVLTFEVME